MRRAIETAWTEDVGPGDITSEACVPSDAQVSAGFLVKAHGVLAGLDVAEAVSYTHLTLPTMCVV